jgi:HEAT repeat protein
MLAIRCLGQVADPAAAKQILAIALNSQHPDAERLAAARSAGNIQESGLEDEARRLGNGQVINRLCAANLLERHKSEAARTLLLALALDAEPSVATAALHRLNAMDASLVLPVAEKVMKHADSGVRREGARCYAANPSVERIAALGKMLDDPVLSLRTMVREDLRRLAGDSRWSEAIRQAAMESLQSQGWRGQEQAAFLLATLDHKPAAPRLVQLLDSPRGEVMVASAWGLRKLAVPDTLPALLQKASQLTDLRLSPTGNSVPLDISVAHLFEALSMMKYKPAGPLMTRYIEKNLAMGENSRSAAIWGLGLLHLGNPDEAIASAILGRVTEPSSALPPEMMRVRLAGTIALGKMKAKSQAAPLRAFAKQTSADKLYMALRWSAKELTGDELPYPKAPTISQSGWFLEPLEERNAGESK